MEEDDAAARTLEQADITVVPTTGCFARATAIGIELDHPAYDAVYLALAEASPLRFVTADDRLIRKIRAGPNRFREVVIALSEVT